MTIHYVELKLTAAEPIWLRWDMVLGFQAAGRMQIEGKRESTSKIYLANSSITVRHPVEELRDKLLPFLNQQMEEMEEVLTHIPLTKWQGT